MKSTKSHYLNYARTETLSPTKQWADTNDNQRLTTVLGAIKTVPKFLEMVQIVSTRTDGQVIVTLLKPLPASERGTLLLDLEEFLKASIDSGLVVWVEPLGDKSSLRNLRGIRVKA